jgi:hypothetical protein
MDDNAAAAIDEDIASGRILPALIHIRVALGCGIPAAIDEFSERYERLRTERTDDFTLPRDEYGHGFYSRVADRRGVTTANARQSPEHWTETCRSEPCGKHS